MKYKLVIDWKNCPDEHLKESFRRISQLQDPFGSWKGNPVVTEIEVEATENLGRLYALPKWIWVENI